MWCTYPGAEEKVIQEHKAVSDAHLSPGGIRRLEGGMESKNKFKGNQGTFKLLAPDW